MRDYSGGPGVAGSSPVSPTDAQFEFATRRIAEPVIGEWIEVLPRPFASECFSSRAATTTGPAPSRHLDQDGILLTTNHLRSAYVRLPD
jgi:hypothetical protein